MACDGVGHRLEPAFDAAVERVVVAALVVGLMRLARDALLRKGEIGEATLPVAAAVGHVEVGA